MLKSILELAIDGHLNSAASPMTSSNFNYDFLAGASLESFQY